ncbi:hypothetical protein D9M70_412710 [compost metagenome]
MLALEVGRDVGGDQSGLDQEGADPAHRVGQRPALGGDARPAGADQHRGGEVLLERRGALLQAVTALVQAVAGEVEGEDRLAALQAQVDAHVGVDLVDRRALAAALAQAVDDGVLDLERTEVGVVDAGAMAAELHGEAAIGRQMLGPVDGQHVVVELVGIGHAEALEHQQHAVGQARPQAQAIGHLQVGAAANGRGVGVHLFQPEAGGLLGEQGFQAFRAGEKNFVTVRHASLAASVAGPRGARPGLNSRGHPRPCDTAVCRWPAAWFAAGRVLSHLGGQVGTGRL